MNEQLRKPEPALKKGKKSVALSGVAAGNTALCKLWGLTGTTCITAVYATFWI